MVQDGTGQNSKKKTNLVVNNVLHKFLQKLGFDQSYAANLLWDIFLNFLPNVRLKRGICEINKHQNALKFRF